MAERIGIAGLGRMGAALAAKSVAEGFATAGWSRSGGDAALAKRHGYALMSDLSALVEESDILILSLFDDGAVDAVLSTLAGRDLSGRLVVETSTVSPDLVRRHAEGIEAAGGRLMDAPISGGPEMVAAGSMGLFLGGAEADVARFRRVADILSNRVVTIGTLGAGIAAKIVNNVSLAGSYAATLDAMRLGRAMGLDLATMAAFLAESPGTTPMVKSRLPAMLGQDATVGFSVDGALKDAAVFLGEGATHGLDLPAMAQMARLFELAREAGLGDRDVAAVARFVLED